MLEVIFHIQLFVISIGSASHMFRTKHQNAFSELFNSEREFSWSFHILRDDSDAVKKREVDYFTMMVCMCRTLRSSVMHPYLNHMLLPYLQNFQDQNLIQIISKQSNPKPIPTTMLSLTPT
jgi:hypothetical protein